MTLICGLKIFSLPRGTFSWRFHRQSWLYTIRWADDGGDLFDTTFYDCFLSIRFPHFRRRNSPSSSWENPHFQRALSGSRFHCCILPHEGVFHPVALAAAICLFSKIRPSHQHDAAAGDYAARMWWWSAPEGCCTVWSDVHIIRNELREFRGGVIGVIPEDAYTSPSAPDTNGYWPCKSVPLLTYWPFCLFVI